MSMKTGSGEWVAKLIAFEFDRIGYDMLPFKWNAAEHGVPQLRNRVFFIGFRDVSAILLSVPGMVGNPVTVVSRQVCV